MIVSITPYFTEPNITLPVWSDLLALLTQAIQSIDQKMLPVSKNGELEIMLDCHNNDNETHARITNKSRNKRYTTVYMSLPYHRTVVENKLQISSFIDSFFVGFRLVFSDISEVTILQISEQVKKQAFNLPLPTAQQSAWQEVLTKNLHFA